MERFVFGLAIVIAVIFGLGAVFGGPNFSGWHFEFDDAHGSPAAVVELAPGQMAATAFAGERLRVRHAVAAITIAPEDRTDFLIEIDNPGGAPMPSVSTEDGRVLIDGNLRGRIQGCREGGGADLRGYPAATADTMPRITIRAPRALDVSLGGANTTEIGPTLALEIDHSGCGVTNAADVEGELSIDFAGSGLVSAGAARSLNADVAGSGELRVGAIADGANIDIAGSGSATIASLNGSLSSDGAGSGNVVVESGAVTQASIDLAGSGGVRIAAPVERLNVSIVGSGDVDVEGDVGDLDAEIAGSGGVSAWAVTGRTSQRVFGSGEVRIGR